MIVLSLFLLEVVTNIVPSYLILIVAPVTYLLILSSEMIMTIFFCCVAMDGDDNYSDDNYSDGGSASFVTEDEEFSSNDAYLSSAL